MTFTEFIKLMPEQKDTGINGFLSWAKRQDNFPASSDPNLLAQNLYNKLNPEMTQGFQKCLMVYASMPNNEIPKSLLNDEPKMLSALNRIIELQQGDKNYKNF